MAKAKTLDDYDVRKVLKQTGKPIAEPLEETIWQAYDKVLGMDEAGRGPICGPVVVAGVIFPKGYTNEHLNDSKKLSAKKREALFPVIVQDALAYQILVVPEDVIDRLNIYRAVQQAMEDIALILKPDWVLSDAMPLPSFPKHEAIIKGDSKSISIAAASILAKVTRDHYMEELDAMYPMYGLARHKGYPTKAHLEAIHTYGIQDFYRRSFKPVQDVLHQPEPVAVPKQISLFDEPEEQ